MAKQSLNKLMHVVGWSEYDIIIEQTVTKLKESVQKRLDEDPDWDIAGGIVPGPNCCQAMIKRTKRIVPNYPIGHYCKLPMMDVFAFLWTGLRKLATWFKATILNPIGRWLKDEFDRDPATVPMLVMIGFMIVIIAIIYVLG